MPKNEVKHTKRTIKGKRAVLALLFEKALKHDVRLAYEICEKYFYDDVRLTLEDDTVLVLAREGQLKKGITFTV
jgi:hypothetical protein